MEYEFELIPFQIFSDNEMYLFVSQVFNYKISDQEFQNGL